MRALFSAAAALRQFPGELHGSPRFPPPSLPLGRCRDSKLCSPQHWARGGQRWPGLFCSLELGLALLFILSRPLVSEPCPACLGWFALGLQGLMEPQKPDLFTGSPQAGPKGHLTERERRFFLSLADRTGAGPGAWQPSFTLASPHCFPHKLRFPGGLIGRLISSLKLWKRQSGAMCVLEIKSINDLTTASYLLCLSPLGPAPFLCALPLCSLLSAFVKVLVSNKVADWGISRQGSKHLPLRWNQRGEEGFPAALGPWGGQSPPLDPAPVLLLQQCLPRTPEPGW